MHAYCLYAVRCETPRVQPVCLLCFLLNAIVSGPSFPGIPVIVFAPALDPKRKRRCVRKAQGRGRYRPCSVRFDPIRSSAPAGPFACADWRRTLSASGSVPPAKTVETAQCTGRDQEGKCRCRELLARLGLRSRPEYSTSMGWPGREC